MTNQQIKYAVMKLLTEVEFEVGGTHKTKLCGCAGYIPVFDTIEEAEKHSLDGKYQIMAIGESKTDNN